MSAHLIGQSDFSIWWFFQSLHLLFSHWRELYLLLTEIVLTGASNKEDSTFLILRLLIQFMLTLARPELTKRNI